MNACEEDGGNKESVGVRFSSIFVGCKFSQNTCARRFKNLSLEPAQVSMICTVIVVCVGKRADSLLD